MVGKIDLQKKGDNSKSRKKFFFKFASDPTVPSIFSVISEFANFIYPLGSQINYHLLHEAFRLPQPEMITSFIFAFCGKKYSYV